MPVREGRGRDAVARNWAVLLQADPMKCRARRRLDCRKPYADAMIDGIGTDASFRKRRNDLTNDRGRLFRFREEDAEPSISIAFRLRGNHEMERVILETAVDD